MNFKNQLKLAFKERKMTHKTLNATQTEDYSIHMGRIGDGEASEKDIFSKLYEESITSEKLRGPSGLQKNIYLNRLSGKHTLLEQHEHPDKFPRAKTSL